MPKIIYYSDLHLELGKPFILPNDVEGDILILAGDIVNFEYHTPLLMESLVRLLDKWDKPVIYVGGNHEYYNSDNVSIDVVNKEFKNWLSVKCPNITLLQDEYITIDGINFFGGTMWTDFNSSNANSMNIAYSRMNDYKYIRINDNSLLHPAYTVELHNKFIKKLLEWFEMDLDGKRVVVTHHCPILHKTSKFIANMRQPAYCSLDMIPIIEKYQPALWVHGHTHECLTDIIGSTIVTSNARGNSNYICTDFCVNGSPTNI